ncbi:MAG: NUDIX hydrolase [Shimia thalassica]|uniref:NUDIX hydrolase n=1 Tax=Shimia thalassica TaxID=1715693 RepID=UPI003298B18C
MTLHIAKPRPIMMHSARKTDLRAQFAALVYRVQNDKTQVLLITSRKTRRWIIPKGWPMSGLTPSEAAAQEAWEEAGVKGITHDAPVGSYFYSKTIKTRGGPMPMPVMTIVYPMQARKLASKYPEAGQRRRKWLSPKKAALRVKEPELAQILRKFDARLLR